MRIQDFLEHHRLKENPFSQVDAREDLVFRRGCIDHTFHPLWEKIYGNPEAPSPAIVFGERGSGKTALRFQIVECIRRFNQEHPGQRVLVLEYQDFNPFIAEFARHAADLGGWELSDHMDAILALAAGRLVASVVGEAPTEDAASPEQLRRLDDRDRRDLLMLAAVYDRSAASTLTNRCCQLARALGYRRRWWLLPAAFLVWPPYLWRWFQVRSIARAIAGRVRVLPHDVAELRRLLLRFRANDLKDQPVCRLDDAARYKLFAKLTAVCGKLGFASVVVVVDRVDEPKLVRGDANTMFQLMRSIFDLKFLGQTAWGVKLLLPMELYRPMRKQLDDNIARLDKHHLCRSLQWSGASLYDLVNARLHACSDEVGPGPTLRGLLDDGVTDDEVKSLLEQLKIPRNVFKFVYDMIAKHCQAHTSDRPAWTVGRDTFVDSRAEFKRIVEDYERGVLMA